MPAQWPVAVNFWADPGDAQATTFLQSLAPYMLRLGAHVRFQTIYNVFSLEGGSEELCLSQGLYEKYPRLYCSFEPNAQVLGLTGGQKHSVDLCMADESGRRLLEFSKNNRGWSIVAMTINGARYSGQLAPEPVLRAICSATVNPMTNKYRAEECNDIVV
ncbi:uncharacterized protein EMH_0095530 [Eimeria mitis]|uniref:Uncharacterized protein n=1 Tax=Eimeria mitis TaxID=44415 RepID=U6KFV0_9EIME|nr:uncharacterized protein EMH_0095530 [Eimeria mitis]CDJ35137.1 hypothetical protein EMH_0095530 [Eimeria mitis]